MSACTSSEESGPEPTTTVEDSQLPSTVTIETPGVSTAPAGLDDLTGCLLVSQDGLEGPVVLIEAGEDEPLTLADEGGHARFSPDGSRIALIKTNADGLVLTVMDSNLAELMSSGEGLLAQPVWSPDGSRLAYTSLAVVGDSSASSQIWLTPVSHFEPTALSIKDLTVEGSPTWSPDGSQLAFHILTSAPTGLVVSAADGSTRAITAIAQNVSNPSWSPTDDKIAFVGSAEPFGLSDLFVARPDGSELSQLTADGWERLAASWSPEGERLAFYTLNDDDTGALFVIDGDGGQLLQIGEDVSIAEDLSVGEGPTWSPDGQLLAYSRHGETEVMVASTDGSFQFPTGIEGRVIDWAASCSAA